MTKRYIAAYIKTAARIVADTTDMNDVRELLKDLRSAIDDFLTSEPDSQPSRAGNSPVYAIVDEVAQKPKRSPRGTISSIISELIDVIADAIAEGKNALYLSSDIEFGMPRDELARRVIGRLNSHPIKKIRMPDVQIRYRTFPNSIFVAFTKKQNDDLFE